MQKGIRKENIYIYTLKRKHTDSELVVAKYFDSTGFCIEKDEYDSSKLVSVTTYSYLDKVLIRKNVVINSGFYNDIMITYDYNENGNKIDEKVYSKSDLDSTSGYELRAEKKWQYDSLNHLSIMFDSKDNILYLSSKYYYNNDTLKLIEDFDEYKKLKHTQYFDYDALLHTKKVYTRKNKKDLDEEFFYDTEGNLVKDVQYKSLSNDINTLSYEYNNGLLVHERFHSKYDDDIYYKLLFY